MKVCDYLEDYLKDDVIGKIYRNDFEVAQQETVTKECKEIIQYMREQEKQLLLYSDDFKKYLEVRNIKDSIEAEEQFKLGFKTAIKIVIESYHP